MAVDPVSWRLKWVCRNAVSYYIQLLSCQDPQPSQWYFCVVVHRWLLNHIIWHKRILFKCQKFRISGYHHKFLPRTQSAAIYFKVRGNALTSCIKELRFKLDISVEGRRIFTVQNLKFLGVVFDSLLIFSAHPYYVIRKKWEQGIRL